MLGIDDETAAKKARYIATLSGHAAESFNTLFAKQSEENEAKPTGEKLDADDILHYTLNEFGKKYIQPWHHGYRRQTRYMACGLYMTTKTEPRKFFERVEVMNSYLPYFPHQDHVDPHEKLDEESLLQIYFWAMPLEWFSLPLSLIHI